MCSKSYTRNPFEKAVSERREKPLNQWTKKELQASISWLTDMVGYCENVIETLNKQKGDLLLAIEERKRLL